MTPTFDTTFDTPKTRILWHETSIFILCHMLEVLTHSPILESGCFCHAAIVSLVASRLLWLPHCVAALLACARRALTPRANSLLNAALDSLSFTNHTIKHVLMVFLTKHLTTVGFLELPPASRTSGYFAKLLIFSHFL